MLYITFLDEKWWKWFTHFNRLYNIKRKKSWDSQPIFHHINMNWQLNFGCQWYWVHHKSWRCMGLFGQQFWWPLNDVVHVLAHMPPLPCLSNAFSGSSLGLKNQIAPYELIFEHWPTMFQNVEQWQTHQFSTFLPTTPLATRAYTNFLPFEAYSMEYPSLPLEVDLY